MPKMPKVPKLPKINVFRQLKRKIFGVWKSRNQENIIIPELVYIYLNRQNTTILGISLGSLIVSQKDLATKCTKIIAKA